jgi:hypothetical protein
MARGAWRQALLGRLTGICDRTEMPAVGACP